MVHTNVKDMKNIQLHKVPHYDIQFTTFRQRPQYIDLNSYLGYFQIARGNVSAQNSKISNLPVDIIIYSKCFIKIINDFLLRTDRPR